MAWNFRKSIKIGPVRVNLSKAGVGASIGVKGFRKGVDAKGRKYTHASIPGTGIYNRTYNKRVTLDENALEAGEFRKLNGAGKLAIAFLLSAFVFIWIAGESFLFAFVLCTITAIIAGIFSNQSMFDIYIKQNARESGQSDTKKLEAELAQLEELEALELDSAYSLFGLDENCTRDNLNHAFKKKIKLYHPDKLENLGPELKELGQKKSKEIIEAYEKCVKLLQQKKSA